MYTSLSAKNRENDWVSHIRVEMEGIGRDRIELGEDLSGRKEVLWTEDIRRCLFGSVRNIHGTGNILGIFSSSSRSPALNEDSRITTRGEFAEVDAAQKFNELSIQNRNQLHCIRVCANYGNFPTAAKADGI